MIPVTLTLDLVPEIRVVVHREGEIFKTAQVEEAVEEFVDEISDAVEAVEEVVEETSEESAELFYLVKKGNNSLLI